MRPLALLAVAACVAACCMAMVQARPSAGGRLDSGVALGDEPLLQRRPTAAGHGLDVHWTKSVYQGDIRIVDNDVPTQTRLAFIPNGMSVSFAMSTQQSSAPVVRFGLLPETLTSAVAATEVRTYGTAFFYTALLQNLQPSTRYYYQISGAVQVNSFVTAHAPGDKSPFSVAIIGDMGLMNSADTMAQLQRGLNGTDFFLHIGDLSYADDFYLRPNNTYEGSWDAWQDLMTPMTSAAPYMSLPGNHEVTCTEVTPFLCPKHQQNMTAYRNRFRMPSRESGGVDSLWYSYDYGSMHFIQINTETDFPSSPMGPGTYYNAGPFGDQLAWFEADLEAAAQNRAAVPWIVVSGHRPWYTSGGKCTACSAAFEALMVKYDVDIYFSGHVHWYERMWPVTLNGVITQQDYNQPKGIVYLVNGAAGNVEGHDEQMPWDMRESSDSSSGASSRGRSRAHAAAATGHSDRLNSNKRATHMGHSDGTARMPYTALVNDQDYGYGRMYVANTTAILWQFLRSADNSVADEIWIHKQH